MGKKSNDSCLDRVDKNEPIFVLRAQDRLAPLVVRLWADLTAAQEGKTHKVTEAIELAKEMDDWGFENHRKFPD